MCTTRKRTWAEFLFTRANYIFSAVVLRNETFNISDTVIDVAREQSNVLIAAQRIKKIEKPCAGGYYHPRWEMYTSSSPVVNFRWAP